MNLQINTKAAITISKGPEQTMSARIIQKLITVGNRNQAKLEASTSSRRSQRGSSLLELPLMLWVMFGLLFVPMLALASITLRGSVMDSVVRDAAHVASKARTFAANTPEGLGAREAATATVTDRLSAFPGITASAVDATILITNISSGVITRSNTPLVAVDSSRNIYQIETTVRGTVAPLLGGNAAIFGNVPGFTTPIQVSHNAREMCENPQGLTR